MAHEIGTASGFVDLGNKLVNFLTTNADLVAAGQQWSVVWTGSGRMPTYPEDIVLRGPGLAGSDDIYVGFRRIPLPGNDRYNWAFRGIVGLNQAALTYEQHTNVSDFVCMHFGDYEMPYWFIANGRRFIVIVRVSSTYQVGYGGFILPYAPPNIWSYPLVVGGTTTDSDLRWSDVSQAMHHFVDPGTGANLKAFRYDNLWDQAQNWSGTYRDQSAFTVSPWNPSHCPLGLDGNSSTREYRRGFFQKIQRTLDNRYVLTPATLVQETPAPAQLGVLEGVFHVPGFNLSAETILDYDGVQYLCIPDINRLGNDFFAAYALNGD